MRKEKRIFLAFLFSLISSQTYADSPVFEQPLICQDVLNGLPPPPDGRASHYCDLAYHSCFIEKMANFQIDALDPGRKDDQKEITEAKKILNALQTEKNFYLKACRLAYNVLSHPSFSR